MSMDYSDHEIDAFKNLNPKFQVKSKVFLPETLTFIQNFSENFTNK